MDQLRLRHLFARSARCFFGNQDVQDATFGSVVFVIAGLGWL